MALLTTGLLSMGAALIDKLIPDPEAKAKAKLDLMMMEQQGELRELQTRMSAIVAEASSPDPWTSRARPSFLYVMYLLFGLCMFGSVLGVWFPVEVSLAATNMDSLFNALPAELYALFGAGYLGYAHYRSGDKRAGVSK